MRTIEAFEKLLILDVATGQVGNGRQAVEIIDVQRGDLIGAEESVVGIAPRATSVTLTAVLKMIHQPDSAEPCAGRCL
jgi:hypothetical protein